MKARTALKLLLGIIGSVLLVHLSFILKIIPYDIAWGGNLENDQQMYIFESISILINLFLAWILLIKGNYVKQQVSPKVVRIVLWVFLVLFVLNTIGNVFAKTNFEKFFALITLSLALLIWVVLKKDKQSQNAN